MLTILRNDRYMSVYCISILKSLYVKFSSNFVTKKTKKCHISFSKQDT